MLLMLDSCGAFLTRRQMSTDRERDEVVPAAPLTLRRSMIVRPVAFPGSLTFGWSLTW